LLKKLFAHLDYLHGGYPAGGQNIREGQNQQIVLNAIVKWIGR
jgi:hypothetical protein